MMTSTANDARCPTEKMIVDYDECKKAAGFLNVKWNDSVQASTKLLPGCFRITNREKWGNPVYWNKMKAVGNCGSLGYQCQGVCRQ